MHRQQRLRPRDLPLQRQLGKPEALNFMGFTFNCGKSRQGSFLLSATTNLQGVRELYYRGGWMLILLNGGTTWPPSIASHATMPAMSASASTSHHPRRWWR